jgi:diguanylate cyclase (GGDEF)-like protein/PAS domain S-box-containing protein
LIEWAMQTRDRKSFYNLYVCTVVAGGALICANSIVGLPVGQIGFPLVMLALVTVIIASRIVVKFFRFNSHISASDVFIFLILLLFGGEAAILVGAAESFYSSTRITKKPLTMAFNAAAMSCSTFITALILRMAFGTFTGLARNEYSSRLILATCTMALAQYVFNSGLVAIAAALWTDQPVWATWKKYYVWTSISYFAGASAAGITARLIVVAGFYAFVALLPVIAIVYLTYLTYVKNVESSAAQAETEKRFHRAFDHAPIGMALASPEGRWLQVNHSLCEIVGYSEAELLERDYQALTHPEDLKNFGSEINNILQGECQTQQLECRFYHKMGHEVWTIAGVSLLSDSQDEAPNLIFQIQDITERKRAEQQLLHEAYHDALTGLPNRAWFVEQLEKSLESVRQGNEELFGVLFLDLDRFKVINDSIGHMYGDQLLVGVAERLRKCLRPGDKVARLGGDEFTILLSGIREVGEVIDVANRIQKEVAQPFKLSGYEMFTTVSIGITLSTAGYDVPEELLRDADTAMYQAKSSGKAQYVIFDKGMHARAMNLLQLESDLRRAIDRREFAIHYQPIVSLKTGKLSGFEALVRWYHPDRGLIPPDKFVSVAEDTGLIVPIGKWVLAEACHQLKLWEQQYTSSLPLLMSVNLSSRQFAHSEILDQIIQTLQVTGIDPRKLKLEITESVVMENVEVASKTLERLRSLGIELSIDDFGTGYSSLSYLHRLPIDTLKIDRSFVSRIHENNENKEIVRTIIMLAQNLGMGVIAEGVETKEQFESLIELKCEHGQGYFFAKPLDAESAGMLIRKTMEEQSGANWFKETSQEDIDLPLASTYPM